MCADIFLWVTPKNAESNKLNTPASGSVMETHRPNTPPVPPINPYSKLSIQGQPTKRTAQKAFQILNLVIIFKRLGLLLPNEILSFFWFFYRGFSYPI